MAVGLAPRLYPAGDDGRHRVCPLRNFPYLLVYRIEDGGLVHVVGFQHAHARPRQWGMRT